MSNSRAERTRRRDEAFARDVKYQKSSLETKLENISNRPGNSSKEYARLTK